MTSLPILPPAMLGIIGGGQLGRMFTIAAKTMGYRVSVLDPDIHAPAAAFADIHLCAAFDDEAALKQLSECAGVTTEFENISAQAMQYLAQFTRVSPSGDCVAIAQNRLLEKQWIQQAGLQTAPYWAIQTAADIAPLAESACFPALLKTTTLGYDGKGQLRVNTLQELKAAFTTMGAVPCILERFIDLQTEISVVLTRTAKNQSTCFPVAENQHKNGILALSIVPARVSVALQQQAQTMAIHLAETLEYIGVLAVEFFVLPNETLLINEIAPRPHNSGHYTLDACASDQFQQQVRALCGLLPARTDLQQACVMVNILGDLWGENGQTEPHWQILQLAPNAHLHLYGKTQARSGRKMGHFTVLADTVEAALSQALAIQETL